MTWQISFDIQIFHNRRLPYGRWPRYYLSQEDTAVVLPRICMVFGYLYECKPNLSTLFYPQKLLEFQVKLQALWHEVRGVTVSNTVYSRYKLRIVICQLILLNSEPFSGSEFSRHLKRPLN